MLVKEYSDFVLENPGCHPGAPVLRANFKLNTDITELFPYINAVGENAIYYDQPHYVQFILDGFRCALYPDQVAAGMFENHEQAIKFINRLINFLNDLDTKTDSIEPNFKKYKHIPVLEIFKLLPRTNCRECGFSTCMAFAAALSKEKIVPDQCPELNNPVNENTIKLKSLLL